MEQLLVCPFTSQPLRPLSEMELEAFQNKIEAGDCYFQKGAPVRLLPKKAFISHNQVYIYLEMGGILLLQKQTAIVAKNRTANPHKRISEQEIIEFYESLGLNEEGTLQTKVSTDSILPAVIETANLEKSLPKTGHCFVTMGTQNVDAVHNLLFGTNFRQYLHFDHDLARLQPMVGALKNNTQYVLCDQELLPVMEDGIDALYSYEFIEGLEKETQFQLFDAMKKSLKDDAVAIILNAGAKSSPLESRYKSVKTKAALKPWKKVSLPQFLFRSVADSQGLSRDAVSGKRSWGSQLS